MWEMEMKLSEDTAVNNSVISGKGISLVTMNLIDVAWDRRAGLATPVHQALLRVAALQWYEP